MRLTRKRFLELAGMGALGAATYRFFDSRVDAQDTPRYPCELPKGNFTYRGRAVAISGHTKEHGRLSEQAVAVLDAENGGHHEGRIEGLAFHGVVFVDTAYSLVTGNRDCATDPADRAKKGVFRSTVSCRVNGLDIDGVVRADTIVANLESAQPPEHGRPLEMLPVGYFTNLRLRGYPIELQHPVRKPNPGARGPETGDYLPTLLTLKTWRELETALPKEMSDVERETAAEAATDKGPPRCSDPAHAYRQPTEKKYETSIFSDRAIRRAVKDIPGVVTCRGGLIHVEDLGDVYLGSYVVEPELRTLTMLRVVLKSPPSGEFMGASVQGDGRPR
jgi:hypothetical protein